MKLITPLIIHILLIYLYCDLNKEGNNFDKTIKPFSCGDSKGRTIVVQITFHYWLAVNPNR